MRTTLLSLIFISSFALTAQKKGSPLSSLDLYYGCRPLFQNFYNQLNTVSDFNFGKPLQIIGIGSSGAFAINRDGHFNGHLIYTQVIPQAIFIGDSLKAKLTGFVFSYAGGGAIATESETFAMYYYIGFNTGRLRMYGNNLVKQKNPFFSPKIGIQPKVKLGNIVVTLVMDCEYDLSKSSWRRTTFSKTDKINLATLRQTAITAQAGIGYILK